MDERTKTSPCKEYKDGEEEVQLQAEVDHLRQHLAERDSHIVALEGEFLRCSAKSTELEEQVSTWREKYERLYDSHKRVQKLNQILEDKLLQMVDKMKGDKTQLTKDIATLSVRLAESKHNVSLLQKENERYKNDMNLAIQLLQCKPDNFVSQRLDNLPVDTQTRVSQYVMSKTKATSPTQSKNGNDNEIFDTGDYEFNISASLMSKILEDSIQDTITKHCDTCTCSKAQNKPFSYDESHYSVSTQTLLSGEMKNSLCLNCNIDIKSGRSNISIRSASPYAVKVVNDKIINNALVDPTKENAHGHSPLPQRKADTVTEIQENIITNNFIDNLNIIEKEKVKLDVRLDTEDSCDLISKIGDDLKHLRKNINTEPGVHHKLCERTKLSVSSHKSSDNSPINDDFLTKENTDIKDLKQKVDNLMENNISLRKNSQSSMGAISRTSSLAKSTTSTHKSNTQVGPGPRFCSLRMQAGSKNILLDNAQPDVPPVLYKRQVKCNENAIFKDLNDGLDNFIELEKNDINNEIKNDNVVVESTLIDVHVENNNKDEMPSKTSSINPVLMNVSSSPLQPLKTHSFSNGSEKNNNSLLNNESQNSTSKVDTALKDFNLDPSNKNLLTNDKLDDISNKNDLTVKTDSHGLKIFNFDHYEQMNKLANQYTRPLKKIDVSQLYSIENTKISKDFPPRGEFPNIPKKHNSHPKASLPAVVNVYPNLTQSHLKVKENKVFTNEQSTSSLSSDDSAAFLQKQQLLRVAEWVEQNLEQQNNLNDPSTPEDDLSFCNKLLRRDSKLHRLTDTLDMALKMPHPVSKYSKTFNREEGSSWMANNINLLSKSEKLIQNKSEDKIAVTNNVAKETIFPVETDESVVSTEFKKSHVQDVNVSCSNSEQDINRRLNDALNAVTDKDITPEELARMEYNVKKFLLSGPQWANIDTVGRSRRTSSKTETDV